MLVYTYDITLVLAALCISVIAAFTGLTLTSGLSALSATQRKAFISMAALALGGGIWSTHFVAMLALRLPVEIGYDPLMTLASVLIAVLLIGVALLLMHFGRRSRRNIAVAGLLVGSGIVAMHYVGMGGIRGCLPQFAGIGPVVTAVVAATMGILAIAISYARRSKQSILAGTVVFGLSVVFTHFTAMYWTGFARLPSDLAVAPSLDNSQLAMIVTLAAFIICAAFLLTASTFAQSSAPVSTSVMSAASGDSVLHIQQSAPVVDMNGENDSGRAPPATPLKDQDEGTSVSKVATDSQLAAFAEVQVPFETDGRIHFLPNEDVCAIRAEGHYTLLYVRGEKLFCPWSITVAQTRLSQTSFFRTHRSYLVNLNRISAFQRRKDKGVCLVDGEMIDGVPVSRSRVNALKDMLGI